jgi:hypothetical protein
MLNMKATIQIDTNNVLRTVASFSLGVSLAGWDRYLSTMAGGFGVTPDPQTVAAIRDANLPLLRLSNGSGADESHFATGDADLAGAGLLASVTEAALADALVTVNYGTGTPEEAAAYAAYLNGTTENTFPIGVDSSGVDWGTVADWATLRGQLPSGGDLLDHLRIGHPDPFGFSLFEVGNEVYFHAWAGAPESVDPKDYVAFAESFSTKVEMISPQASIGLGVGNPIEWDDLWNIPMLQECAAQGFTPGFLSDHFYVYDGHEETLSDQELLTNTVSRPGSTMPIHAFAPRNWAGRAQAYRSLLSGQLGASGDAVRLICAEFNSDADSANKQSTSLVRGLLVADAIGSALLTEYCGVIYWDLRNSYLGVDDDPSLALYGWREGGDSGLLGSDSGTPPATGPYVFYPSYFGVQLASKIATGCCALVYAASDVSELSVYAGVQTDGHLKLLLINKSPMVAFDTTVDIAGFSAAGTATSWQYGTEEDNAQSTTADGAASLTMSSATVAATAAGVQVTSTFPAYSMTVLEL